MKSTAVAIVIAGLMIGGTILFTNKGAESQSPIDAGNVSVIDGVQVVNIDARGGYSPRKSVAQAGIPTVIRFNTKGTFDCSLAVRIPSMNISKFLPQTGSTDIDLGTREAGTLSGSCSMGMYPFSIEFQ